MTLELARKAMKDEDRIRAFMQQVLELKALRGEDWNATSPDVIRDIWFMAQELCGERDYYADIKREQNRQAMRLLPLAKESVLKSPDPFLEAVKFAAEGNAFSALGNLPRQPSEEVIKKLQNPAINLEGVEELKRRLEKARRVVYLGDNCGEIVFDRLLIEHIRERYDAKVVFVTRSLPVLNDALLQDALSVGMDRVASVVENGIKEPMCGTLLDKVSPEIKLMIEEADLVISKGGGNYDTLTEEDSLRGKILFLLKVKCEPYSIMHQVPLGTLLVQEFR
jgi:uncharacterized protein with ATP-grasp and redox domains